MYGHRRAAGTPVQALDGLREVAEARHVEAELLIELEMQKGREGHHLERLLAALREAGHVERMEARDVRLGVLDVLEQVGGELGKARALVQHAADELLVVHAQVVQRGPLEDMPIGAELPARRTGVLRSAQVLLKRWNAGPQQATLRTVSWNAAPTATPALRIEDQTTSCTGCCWSAPAGRPCRTGRARCRCR